MKKTFLATLLLSSMILTACSIKVTDGESDGKEITTTLEVKDFNSINLNGSADVEFSQADTYKVELIATKEGMKGVQTTVKDSVLTISRENSGKTKNGTIQLKMSRSGYKLRISAPSLKAVHMSGSGEFYAKTPIKAETFDTSVTGSGELHLGKVTANSISVGVSGSGDAEIKAFSKTKADFRVTGSGDIEADVTGCADVTADVTGSGDIEAKLVNCGHVDASTSGSGDITLKGNAKSVNANGKGVNTEELITK